MGNRVWRSDAWLRPARPVLVAAAALTQLLAGLDRVYADPAGRARRLRPAHRRVGEPRPAACLAERRRRGRARRVARDRRGRSARPADDARRGGNMAPPAACPSTPPTSSRSTARSPSAARTPSASPDGGGPRRRARRPAGLGARGSADHRISSAPLDATARTFGQRPLVAAIEDGWPLVDGTAIVARDGALGRVRLSDGALVERVAEAFPLKPSRCHPLSLPRKGDPGAFGFVCGESHGATVVYRFGATEGRLVELPLRRPARGARVRQRGAGGPRRLRGRRARRGQRGRPGVLLAPAGRRVDRDALPRRRRRPRAPRRAGGRARRDGAPAEGRRPVDGAPDGHGRRQVRARPV